MKKILELHALINKLSKKEIEQLQNQYQKDVNETLLELLISLRGKEIDEDQLAQIIKAKNLDEKSFLIKLDQAHKLIFDYHRSKHRKASWLQAQEALIEIHILIEQGEIEIAQKKLVVLKKKAKKNFQSTILIAVNKIERRLVRRIENRKERVKRTKQLIKEANFNLATLAEEIKILNAYDEIKLIRDAEQGFNEFDSSIFEITIKEQSFETQIAYHTAKAMYHTLSFEFEKSFFELETCIEMMDKSLKLVRGNYEYSDRYIRVVNNYLVNGLKTAMLSEHHIQKYLGKVKKVALGEDKHYLKAQVFQIECNVLSTLYFGQSNFNKIIEMLPMIRNGINKYGSLINKHIINLYYSNLACSYLLTNDLDNAVKHLNYVELEEHPIKKSEIQMDVNIWRILYYIEIENPALIFNEIDKFLKNYRDQKRSMKYQFIKVVEKSEKTNSNKPYQEFYTRLESTNGYGVKSPIAHWLKTRIT